MYINISTAGTSGKAVPEKCRGKSVLIYKQWKVMFLPASLWVNYLL